MLSETGEFSLKCYDVPPCSFLPYVLRVAIPLDADLAKAAILKGTGVHFADDRRLLEHGHASQGTNMSREVMRRGWPTSSSIHTITK